MTNETKLWGLIDYHVSNAENGWWYVSKTCHEQTPPGDHSPHDEGIVAECKTEKEAVHTAKGYALEAVERSQSRCAAVFNQGDEVLFVAQGRKWASR